MRPECSIPLRNFLETPWGSLVSKSCAEMRVAWTLGAALIISLGLLWSHVITKRQEEVYLANQEQGQATIVVPFWLCFLPIVYAGYVFFTAEKSAEHFWKTESLHFKTYGNENKKEFLNYRSLDDRNNASMSVAAKNALLLGSIPLIGPVLRADSSR